MGPAFPIYIPSKGRHEFNITSTALSEMGAGWCTIQFNAFLQGKMRTQSVKGGNTDELYKGATDERNKDGYAIGGTDAKSAMLARIHPDVSRVVWKYGRVHHSVNYKAFSGNILHRKADAIPTGTNEYGMALKRRKA